MAITATTLSGAVAATDTQVGVAAATGISAPVTTTGAGFTFLKVDDEIMFVTTAYVAASLYVPVLRGQLGTQAVAHVSGTPVLIGGPSDYPNFVPVQTVEASKLPYNFSPIGPPLAISSNTVAPTNGYIHHVTGTTVIKTITVPAGLVSGGQVTFIFDGSGSGLTWDATDNIAVAGTSTTAASAVDFFYDPSSAKWHPSRLA